MRKAEPRYTVPSRQYFSQNHIPNAFEKAVNHVRSIITNECKSVRSLSFTTDGWTSRSNESYISLTVHYVTEEWKLRHITLNLEHSKDQNTATNLNNLIVRLIEKWSFCKDIPMYFITDNAPNLVAALKKVPDGYTWQHLRCVAYSLQLVIVDAKKSTSNLEALLIACKSIVGHYKRSSTAKARLFELQKKENISPPLMLIQDVKTRWNSEYLMLQRIYELKKFISANLIESNSKIDNLTRDQYSTIEGLLCVLQPLYKATNDLCSSSFPTAASIIFYLHYIIETLRDLEQNNSNVRTFASKVSISITSHFPSF
uniref:Zinc finger BED domain-containing protein 1 n=1 Tax=Sipha flava TaxID=143950 RepID=A0A2S2Q777_9HEMI